jgi:S-adenosylmethionine-diacylglycerol 3-amino-3-carboxypropyl transferase
MSKYVLNYSQCWEDPEVLKKSLDIKPDDVVLSVTSGGDNTIALVMLNPQKVVSIDIVESQNKLLELKLAAARNLNYEEYLCFLGIKDSKNRIEIFEKIKDKLPQNLSIWWSHNYDQIKVGVINSGKFEKFSRIFSKYIIKFLLSKKEIDTLLSFEDINLQRNFYRKHFDNWRWNFLFGIFSSKFILSNFARQKGMFAYEEGGTANIYKNRLEKHLNYVVAHNNFFMSYSLKGFYGESLPPYLTRAGYLAVKERDELNLEIVTGSLIDYLKSMPDNTFSKFNLSDIFEALSVQDNNTLWTEIIRTSKNGAIVVYWNNLIERSYPSFLSGSVKEETFKASKISQQDRVFFYGGFSINTINK